MRFLRAGLVALLLAAPASPALAQCAMCQTALTGSPEGRQMAGHLNYAILVMLVAPYLMIGTFLTVAFRARIGRAAGTLLARARALAPALPAVRSALLRSSR